MKRFFLCFFSLTAFALSAQLDFGIRAGLNAPGLNVREFTAQSEFESLESSSRNLGFHAGFYGRINAVVLFVQPELLYTFVNQSLTAKASAGGNDQELSVNLHRLDIPLLVGQQFGPFRYQLGPVYSVNLGEAGDAIDSDNLRSGTFGYQLGLGVKISKFSIDLRYEGHFSGVTEEIILNNTSYETDLRVDQLILALGYELF